MLYLRTIVGWEINQIHELALKLGYQHNFRFFELLDLENSLTVHHKNFQVLVTGIYKVENGIVLEIMKDIIELQNLSHNLRSSDHNLKKKT